MSTGIARRIHETQQLLTTLGLDRERANERSAVVLLGLLGMRPDTAWTEAGNPLLGTRAIMDWARDQYDFRYAPNTRETVRRSTLHQFVDAMLVERNPDDPTRAVNSPKSCYRIHPRALEVIRQFGQPGFAEVVVHYRLEVPDLKSVYTAARSLNRIPVALPGGATIDLSPGGQNDLIKKMIEEFCAYYTKGAEVLYVGDADAKWAVCESVTFQELGVSFDPHGKMPDLVVYLRDRNWLVLLEAASSHGPVDAKRHLELRSLFQGTNAKLLFVSCFPDRRKMRRYLPDIAWETEVWCADEPMHLIHFDGERLMDPYEP